MSRRVIYATLVLALGCTGRQVSNGGDSAGDDGASTDGGDSSGDAGGSQSGAAPGEGDSGDGGGDDGGGGGGTAPPPAATCADGSDFAATAELIDTGLGPGGAAVAIENCTEVDALLVHDCCFGPAFHLQRRDEPTQPWRDALPDIECDCAALEPMVIAPGTTYEFETDPSPLDSEPICGVGSLEYRYILRAARSDCEDCWQDVPTTPFDWYCEG